MKFIEKSKENSASDSLIPIKPIPQLKKTKSNRNVFDKNSTKSSGASSKCLSIPKISRDKQGLGVKHSSHKNVDKIIEKPDLKRVKEDQSSNFLQVGKTSLKCSACIDLYKIKSFCHLILIPLKLKLILI